MQSSAPDRYLETAVLTAPPQKLHLMLVEAAIRSAERARRHMQAEDHEKACDALIHAQQVVTELLGGLNRDADAPLAKKAAAIYLFVFRGLVDAGMQRDLKKLDDVLRVLRVEQETWRQVCRNVGNDNTPEAPAGAPSPWEPAPSTQAPPAELPGGPDATDGTSSGFSLEA